MSVTVQRDDFLSGQSGHVAGIRATTRAVAADLLGDAAGWARLRPPRLRRAAARWPRRRVLVLAVERPQANLWAHARRELMSSHHDVRIAAIPMRDRGKFENLNALLAEHPVEAHDWLVTVDDDVALPAGFLDAFIFLAERFGFRLAQPAHRARSHAAWPVTRRRPGCVARATRFVEIGPVTAFQAATFETLLPFPALRVGWGLDLHWSALAREHRWPIGVIDATPIAHALHPVSTTYDSADAIREARSFLAHRPYTAARDALTTVSEHRRW
jgi:hypothetical protein